MILAIVFIQYERQLKVFILNPVMNIHIVNPALLLIPTH